MTDHGMAVGTHLLESVGAVTFGRGDVLFVADNRRAAVVAIDVADPSPAGPGEPFDLEDLDVKLASYIGYQRRRLEVYATRLDAGANADLAPVVEAEEQARRQSGLARSAPGRRLSAPPLHAHAPTAARVLHRLLRR